MDIASTSVPKKDKPKSKVKKLNKEAVLPTKGSKHAAGHDLYACEDYLLKSGTKALLNTQIAIELPEESYGRIAPPDK